MKFSSSFVVYVMLAACVSAAPASSVQSSKVSATTSKVANPKSTMSMGPAKGKAAGAAYFITNEPSGNFVVSADIGTDGKLALRQATSTNGLGAHGLTAKPGPDPLFGQGSVKASAASNMLAAVNPGSNTVSVFKINPNSPSSIKLLGNPVGSGGDFPMSVAFNKAGDTICTLNGGAMNGVNCFKIDPNLGPVPLPDTNRALNVNQTTPATGPAGSLSHIAFDESNQHLMAAVKGVPGSVDGFIAIWDVSQSSGSAGISLSKDFRQLKPAQGGGLPFSMTIIPGQNAMLSTDAAIGFDIFDLSNAGNAQNGTSSKTSANKIDGQGAVCWSSFSPKTKNFYVTDIITSQVTEINVDGNLKPTVVKQYAQGNTSSTIDNEVASVGSNDFLYVLSPGTTSINVLSLNSPGNAKQLQNVEFSKAAKAAGLTINGNNVQGMTTFVKK